MSDTQSRFPGLREDFETIFVKEWSPYLGALLLVLVVVALMTTGLFWGVFGGVKYWGDRINGALGLAPLLGIAEAKETLLTHRMSLMNILLVAGAFTAALMSGQFQPNRAPRLEYVWAALGGSAMGIGASLAGGCTTGGFFNPVVHSSPAGWVMWLGLLTGAWVGLKALMWTLDHVEWGTVAPAQIVVPPAVRRLYPLAGLAVAIGVVAWSASWWSSPDKQLAARALIVVAGFAIGFVMHRSRLCFARSIREPFMTAEGTMTKAVILAMAVGIPLAALLFRAKVIDPYVAIPPTFWIGSLVGGAIFGVGMVFAGGCASGALWRMGEGHAKLWVAMLFFAWIGSIASAVFKKLGLTAIDETNVETWEMTGVGRQAFFPDLFGGWGWALLAGFGLLAVWYAVVRWNETTEKLTVL
ncbi:MAG: YeeE/YedE family protein [Phyllobacteriaceae bacterium]|nr:YeeE/YedE family protein [Phyllobacteriaceae bacterium]